MTFRTVCQTRTRTHTIYLEKIGVDVKATAKCDQIQLPKCCCREAGRRAPTAKFQCMLGCIEGEIGIIYMTKIGRKSGMPLISWWSEEVTAETLMFWRLKFQGLGVRKDPAQVVFLRSFFLCSENGLVRLVNGGEASKPQPGRSFENHAHLVNIFKVVVVYQMSCVSMTCCQTLFVSGNVTLWNTNWTKTSHSLVDKFLAPKSYGSETLFAEQFGGKRLRRARDNTGGQNPQPFQRSPQGRVFHLQRPTCHQNRACFWFTKHLWVRVWSCCLVQRCPDSNRALPP